MTAPAKAPAIPPLFRALLLRAGLPLPEREVRFSPPRRWRLDYAWPAHRLALEVEGAIWTNGRHTRGSGYLKDLEKYNALAVQGWRLLRVTPQQLATPDTITLIRRCLDA